MKIDKPGIYEISDEEYHSDPVVEPSLSSSIGKLLIEKTPMHAWAAHPRLNPEFAPDEDKKFDFGDATHDLFLRGRNKMKVIEAENWRTKAARQARDQARAEGLVPMLPHEAAKVASVCQCIRAHLEHHREAADAFTAGRPEITLVWQEEVEDIPIWCRGKLDWFRDVWLTPADLKGAPTFIDDVKTTTDADAKEFRKRIFDLGHDVSIMFHARGLAKLTGVHAWPRFTVAEIEQPHGVNVIGLLPEAIDLANAKIDEMLRRWAYCIKGGSWRGYAPFVSLVDAPPWHIAEFEERLERRKAITAYLEKHTAEAGKIDPKAIQFYGM